MTIGYVRILRRVGRFAVRFDFNEMTVSEANDLPGAELLEARPRLARLEISQTKAKPPGPASRLSPKPRTTLVGKTQNAYAHDNKKTIRYYKY